MKKKQIKRIYKRKIKIPLYDKSFDIVIGKGNEDMNDYYRKRLSGDGHEFGIMGAFFSDKATLLINLDSTMNTITHELIHVLHTFGEFVGMELSNSSQEAYAYLAGFLMEEIINHMNEAKKYYKRK